MPFEQRDHMKVIEEFLYHSERFNVVDFAFYDDALFINKKEHINKILRALIRSKLNLRLHTPNGLFAKEIDPELAALMYDSGFKTIRLSFETSNEKRRADMGSKVSNLDIINAVSYLEKAGFRRDEIDAYILMGLPGQSIDEVMESVTFLQDLGVKIRLCSYSPIHNTKDFNRAVENHLIDADIDPLLTNKTIFTLLRNSHDIDKLLHIKDIVKGYNEKLPALRI